MRSRLIEEARELSSNEIEESRSTSDIQIVDVRDVDVVSVWMRNSGDRQWHSDRGIAFILRTSMGYKLCTKQKIDNQIWDEVSLVEPEDEESTVEESAITVSDDQSLKILTQMINDKVMTDSAARFLGLENKTGEVSFGQQGSANTRVGFWRDYGWPRGNEYYFKEYRLNDEQKANFIKEANSKISNMRSKMKKAIKFAGSYDNYKEIIRQLEQGYSIEKGNKRLENDDRRTWRMLDDAVSGKHQNDNNYMSKWKALPIE